MNAIKLSEIEAKKPIGMDSTGKFLTIKDFEQKKPYMALATLDPGMQKELVLRRNEMEPDYEISIISGETFTRAELLEEIKQETQVGMDAVRAEISYLSDIHAELAEEAAEVVGLPDKIKVEKWPPKQYSDFPRKWWPIFFRRFAVFAEDTSTAITAFGANYRMKYVHPCFPKTAKINPIVLSGPNDIRPNFETACLRKGVVYISGIGHGSPTVYTGYRGNRLWEECKYSPEEVKGKLIHLLSCLTARKLGPDLIKKGACAYFGYIENFYITKYLGKYVTDFIKCDSAIDLSLCRGMNAEEATYMAIRTYNEAIKKWRGIHGPTATWLTWDRDALRTPVHGRQYGERKGHLREVPFLGEMEEELKAVEIKDVETAEEEIDIKKFTEELLKD